MLQKHKFLLEQLLSTKATLLCEQEGVDALRTAATSSPRLAYVLRSGGCIVRDDRATGNNPACSSQLCQLSLHSMSFSKKLVLCSLIRHESADTALSAANTVTACWWTAADNFSPSALWFAFALHTSSTHPPILKCSESPKLSTGGSNSTRTVSRCPAVPSPCGCPSGTGMTRPRSPTAPGSSPNSLNDTCSNSSSREQQQAAAQYRQRHT